VARGESTNEGDRNYRKTDCFSIAHATQQSINIKKKDGIGTEHYTVIERALPAFDSKWSYIWASRCKHDSKTMSL
jgi:hypothetical protein